MVEVQLMDPEVGRASTRTPAPNNQTADERRALIASLVTSKDWQRAHEVQVIHEAAARIPTRCTWMWSGWP